MHPRLAMELLAQKKTNLVEEVEEEGHQTAVLQEVMEVEEERQTELEVEVEWQIELEELEEPVECVEELGVLEELVVLVVEGEVVRLADELEVEDSCSLVVGEQKWVDRFGVDLAGRFVVNWGQYPYAVVLLLVLVEAEVGDRICLFLEEEVEEDLQSVVGPDNLELLEEAEARFREKEEEQEEWPGNATAAVEERCRGWQEMAEHCVLRRFGKWGQHFGLASLEVGDYLTGMKVDLFLGESLMEVGATASF